MASSNSGGNGLFVLLVGAVCLLNSCADQRRGAQIDELKGQVKGLQRRLDQVSDEVLPPPPPDEDIFRGNATIVTSKP
jgi:hypothetical protein